MISRSNRTPYGLQHRPRRRVILPSSPVEHWSWTPFDAKAAALRPRDAPRSRNAVQTNYRPTGRRQRVVLVFEAGAQSTGIVEALRGEGLKFFFLDFLELMERGRVHMSSAASDLGAFTLGPARVLFRDVAAVVWVEPLSILNRVSTKRTASNLLLHRWMQVLRDLKALLPGDTLWMPSHPLNGSNDWQEKLSELVYAREAGLETPETIFTNDPGVASPFIARHRGKVLFRELSKTEIGFRTAFATMDARQRRSLPHSPCGFQRFVDKEYDVRAVAIGDRVFACRIDSQASASARIDWRVYDNAHVKWERMRLPRGVEGSILRLMNRLDINWGSFDLVKGKDGIFYFLEVNRPGASYWLLPFVGLDVPRELAAYIARLLNAR